MTKDKKEQVRQLLVKLLKVEASRLPWKELQQAFAKMPTQAVQELLRKNPEVFAGHLLSSFSNEQIETAQAIIVALRKVKVSQLSDARVIAVVAAASTKVESATELAQELGVQKIATACLELYRDNDEWYGWSAGTAFVVLCKHDWPGRYTVLAKSMKDLCATLPNSSHPRDWHPYWTACKVVKLLIEAGQDIPELASRLDELAVCPSRIDKLCPWTHDALEELISVIQVVREHFPAGQYLDSDGQEQSIPGARATILCLARCYWWWCSHDIYYPRKNVEVALRLFSADEVTDVVVHNFLPEPGELKQGYDDDYGEPMHFKGEARYWSGSLILAAEMLAADKTATRTEDILSYCRRAFQSTPAGKDRVTWLLAPLATLGSSGANVIREFLMDEGYSSWDFAATRAFARAINNADASQTQVHLELLLDEKECSTGQRSKAGSSIGDLDNTSAVALATLALNRLERRDDLTEKQQAALLSAISSAGRSDVLLGDGQLFDRAVDAGLVHYQNTNPILRGAALRLLARILRVIYHRNGEGWPSWIEHQRVPEIADAAILGIGDADEETRKAVRYKLCESTQDNRAAFALAILKALCKDPKNEHLTRMLSDTSDLGYGYWHSRMVGLAGGDQIEYLKQAQTSENKMLRDHASLLFPWVLEHAPDGVRIELLRWLKKQLTLPRNRQRRVLPAVLNFAQHCPELAGKHPWIVERVARCESWDPKLKIRILQKLCGEDVSRFVRVVKQHCPNLAEHLDDGDSSGAAALGAMLNEAI